MRINYRVNDPIYEKIDIYEYFTVYNLTDYGSIYDHWEVGVDETLPQSDENLFFMIEHGYDDAFGHWVYESAVFLECFKLLKGQYPTIKLCFRRPKTYKSLFCKLFEITENDIIYDLPKQNKCFLPPYTTNLGVYQKDIDIQRSTKYYKTFFTFFKELTLPDLPKNKYVIMPRQTKENFKPNNRDRPLVNIISHFKNNNIPFYLLNTDEITDIKDQIQIVRSAENIILTDGSPCAVNGMFCSNKNIHVIENFTIGHERDYINVKIVFKFIREFNNNQIIYYANESDFLNRMKL